MKAYFQTIHYFKKQKYYKIKYIKRLQYKISQGMIKL